MWYWLIEFVFECFVFVGCFDVCNECGGKYLLVGVYGLECDLFVFEDGVYGMMFEFVCCVVDVYGFG